ncbi:MAG: Hpt domain-containing protein [Desulfovibrionales bacterium]
MNQDFFDPEIFSDFILEAREHLETIEPMLLELEKEPEDLTLLNEIFRPMHSLKGASGFLGLNTINGLAHRAENILDELRKGNIMVSTEIMDVILAATDALGIIISNLEVDGQEGDVDTALIIERIESLLAGNGLPPGGSGEGDTDADPECGEPYSLSLVGEEHLSDFLEEAREIVSDLNQALLSLEKDPTQGEEIIHDVFRYFHNLKGNSGILGFTELNSLTHEAETLLNRIRKGEMVPTRALIDDLLSITDLIETLIGRIDPQKGTVIPLDIASALERLQAAGGGEPASTSEAAAKTGEPEPADPGPDNAVLVDPEDLAIFQQTIGQQFETITLALASLREDSGQKEFVDALHRSLVTIQNSSAYMELDEVLSYAERTAGLVDQARSNDMDFSLMVDILEQEVSILQDMVTSRVQAFQAAAVATPQSGKEAGLDRKTSADSTSPRSGPQDEAPSASGNDSPAPSKKEPSAACASKSEQSKPVKSATTIRVDHEKLDHLMNLIGELIINRNRFSLLAREIEGRHGLQEVAQQLTETTYSMARISDDLQDTIMKVRMVPVKSVFSRFPRLVRDLSQKSGKQVELITDGEETELDKSVVEEIGDPLVHLIRNSVDHGLEDEQGRKSSGKDPVGRVWLRASHRGNSVIIEVEDDGKGIDPDRMREKGVEKGILTEEEARAMDDQQAVELIFAAGFSTAEQVTDISGRGVGMDVVRNNIKNLKGSVSVQSEVGKGTKFTLSLPLTLAIIDALMVEVAGGIYAIPLDAVSETTKLEARKFTEVNDRKAVTLRGEVLGIVELTEILGMEEAEDARELVPIVVVTVNERRLGIIVDRLLERQEIVIKSLGTYLGDLHGISGATIMGDGSVVLILDPNEIYMRATSKAAMM